MNNRSLNSSYFLVYNNIADVGTKFHEVGRMISWLRGKRVDHLTVYVVKNDRCKLLNVEESLTADALSALNSL